MKTEKPLPCPHCHHVPAIWPDAPVICRNPMCPGVIAAALTGPAAIRAWNERAPVSCPVHDGQVHGGEAQELRKGIEALIEGDFVSVKTEARLQRLLDSIDARDSLAHLESRAALFVVEEFANGAWAMAGESASHATREDAEFDVAEAKTYPLPLRVAEYVRKEGP